MDKLVEKVADLQFSMDIGILDCPTSIKLQGIRATAEWKAKQLIPIIREEERKRIVKYLDEKLGYDYSGVRTEEILALKESE